MQFIEVYKRKEGLEEQLTNHVFSRIREFESLTGVRVWHVAQQLSLDERKIELHVDWEEQLKEQSNGVKA
jgi:hypothetical protein